MKQSVATSNNEPQQMSREQSLSLFSAVFTVLWFLAYGWLWYNHAWISEDALITMRQVGNFVEGNGMVWNLGERVQAFTHPTWFFLLSLGHAISGELYWMAFALCFIFTTLALVRMLSITETLPALLVMSVLLFSQAFIDYTSTALENPLSYFLMALIITRYFKGQYDVYLFLLMGLAFLTRMDHAAILLPMALMAWWRTRFSIVALLPGVGLVLAWFAFSTFYFGYPLPNTFMAKLGTTFPFEAYWERFVNYTRYTLDNDPLTLAVIATGIVLPLLLRSRAWVLSAGLGLYVVYLARIGGDWMAGRFFAIMIFVAVWALIVLLDDETLPRRYAWGFLVFVPLALIGGTPFANGPGFSLTPEEVRYNWATYGISNARTNEYDFFRDNSLSNFSRGTWPQFSGGDTPSGDTVALCGAAGIVGILNNTDYIIDMCALGSGYTARVPAMNDPDYTTGHHARRLPEHFLPWLNGEAAGVNLPVAWYDYDPDQPPNPELTRYFEDIRLVISGPLFSGERLQAIWRLNTSDYDFDTEPFSHFEPETRGALQRGLSALDEKTFGANDPIPFTWENLDDTYGYEVNLYHLGGAQSVPQVIRAEAICDPEQCQVELPVDGVGGAYDLWVRPLYTESLIPYHQWYSARLNVALSAVTLTQPVGDHPTDAPLPLRFSALPGASLYIVDVYRPVSGVERYELAASDICTADECAYDIDTLSETGTFDVWVSPISGDEAGPWASMSVNVQGAAVTGD